LSDQEQAGDARRERDTPRPRTIDGATLRSVRTSQRVSLRRIARATGMSHGHLSAVERGVYGRLVTPAIINAYEKTLGVKLAEVAAGEIQPAAGKPRRLPWQSGQMTHAERRQLMVEIAATSAGAGDGTAATRRRLAHAGAMPVDLDNPGGLDVLERVVDTLDQLAEPAGAVAHLLLNWALTLPDLLVNDRLHGVVFPPEVQARVQAVISRLARRAAHGAQAGGRQEAARSLYLLALAAAADDPDLRGEALADLAQQHVTVGYPEDALGVIRLAEGDERIGETTRARLKAVRSEAEGTEEPS
jgi:transcriptional regulator with XRE-family HTH domain